MKRRKTFLPLAGAACFLAIGLLTRLFLAPKEEFTNAGMPAPRAADSGIHAPVSPKGGTPAPGSAGLANRAGERARVDINEASVEELISLKGLGPVLARNIAEYRRKNGRFRSVADLLRVKGIGAKKLNGLRDSVTVNPE
jgi:competence protein ComEA